MSLETLAKLNASSTHSDTSAFGRTSWLTSGAACRYHGGGMQTEIAARFSGKARHAGDNSGNVEFPAISRECAIGSFEAPQDDCGNLWKAFCEAWVRFPHRALY
jgi:hypothetical protein